MGRRAIESRRPSGAFPAWLPIVIGLVIGASALVAAIGLRGGLGGEQAINPPSAGPTEPGLEPMGDDPDAFAKFLLNGGADSTAIDRYIAAEQQIRDELARRAALEESGDDRAVTIGGLGAVAQPWTWLGPKNFGGRTRAFVVSPVEPNVMFAAGITGGIWRSEDRGESWVPMIDTLSNISVGVIAIDPTNPKVLYAGTGEAYYRPQQWYRGNGIMKSTDGGLTWAFLPATSENDAFDWVGDIVVSRSDPQRVYAATGTGVWLSTDGGASWGKDPVLASGRGAGSVGCMDLAIRTDRKPDVVFASCGHGRSPDGVYRSDRGGKAGSWQRILPVDRQPVGFVALAIAPSNQEIVYASATDTSEGALGLYRSTSGGAPGSWELRTSPERGAPKWLDNCRFPGNGQGDYDNAIAVDPTDPDRIWVGGIDLFRSTDGGRTLKIASDWGMEPKDGTPYTHADQHLIVFDPAYDGKTNRTVYFANDGGLYRTDDDRADLGKSTCANIRGIAYRSMNRGYGITQFVGGSVTANGSVVLGGTQDNGSYRLDVGAAGDWKYLWGGDGGQSAIDPGGEWLIVSNPAYLSSDQSYMGLAAFRLTGAARTGDSVGCRKVMEGRDCQWIGEGIEDKAMVFYPPLEQDPSEPDVLWSGGTRAWRSLGVGAPWSASGRFDAPLTALAIAPSDSKVVYAGSVGGGLFRTTNGRAGTPTWSAVRLGGPKKEIGSIAIHPKDARTVYVGLKSFSGNQLWRSVEGGPFEAIDAGLPDSPVNAIAINPRNPSMVYVGTDVGVFESLDGGTTWRVANENLASTIISRLVFRRGTSQLFAFTFGRGAYTVDVGDQSPPVNDLIASAKEVQLAPEFRDAVDIRSASVAPDDPPLSCGSPLAPAQAKTIWYRFTDPAGGTFAVSTQGSNYDTVVAVHELGGAGVLSEVACDDNGAPARTSALTFTAEPGVTYFVEVARSARSGAATLGNSLRLVIWRP